MATIHSLPNELTEAVVRQMSSPRDKVNFGSTCRRLWDISKSEIFRSVTVVSSSTKSSFSVFLAASNHGQLIKELTVVLDKPTPVERLCPDCGGEGCEMCEVGYQETTDEDFQGDDERWKFAAHPSLTLLKGTYPGLTPNLKTLNIVLPKSYYGDFRAFMHGTHDAMTKVCSRMNELLVAAATNKASTITSLSIRNLPPNSTSGATKKARLPLLRRLERFELSLYGEKPEMETTNAHGNFPPFVANLKNNFFDHLTSVKSVKIEASPHCIVGHHAGEHAAPLYLGHATMPKLRDLELMCTVIDQSFMEFMENRPSKSPPLNLTLTNTMCFDYEEYTLDDKVTHSGFKWREVFDKLTKLADDKNLPGIQSFTASFLDQTVHQHWEDDERPEDSILKKLAAEQPERIMFSYVHFDDEWAYLIGHEWTARDEFKSGKDQAAYDKFMDAVARCRLRNSGRH